MKNLNPASGLKQVTSGYICLSRIEILNHIRNGSLKPNELAFYFLFVISADWDVHRYRKGYIRHELPVLSQILNIPYTTLLDNLKKLIKKGLVSVERVNNQSVYKINNFDHFSQKHAQEIAKRKMSDEDLKMFFPELLSDYEISNSNQTSEHSHFKGSSKGCISVDERREIEESINESINMKG